MAKQADETPAALTVVPAAAMAPPEPIKTTRPAGVLPESIGDASEEGLDSCDTSFAEPAPPRPDGQRDFGFEKLFKKKS
jgi:hypothetical protein